jgi:hypothetical protein
MLNIKQSINHIFCSDKFLFSMALPEYPEKIMDLPQISNIPFLNHLYKKKMHRKQNDNANIKLA